MVERGCCSKKSEESVDESLKNRQVSLLGVLAPLCQVVFESSLCYAESIHDSKLCTKRVNGEMCDTVMFAL